MNKLTFSENWLVGHKQIDDEHKELLSQINRMIDDLKSQDLRELKSAMSAFCESVIRHCDHEDQIMKELGCHADMHEESHDKAIQELQRISATLEEHNMEQKLLDVISIFVRKILMSDIYFGDYLKTIQFEN